MKDSAVEPEWEQFKSALREQLLIYMKSPRFKNNVEETGRLRIEMQKHLKDINALLNLAKRTNDRREIAIVHMTVFLWNYEIVYMYYVDFLCHLLTTNGHDLYDPFKQKYADSFADIGEIDAATKLRFLEEHNFRVFKRKKDRELRNKIAHYDLLLDETGKVKIDDVEIDVRKRNIDLLEFIEKVSSAFIDISE
jgi:hypothetical protein